MAGQVQLSPGQACLHCRMTCPPPNPWIYTTSGAQQAAQLTAHAKPGAGGALAPRTPGSTTHYTMHTLFISSFSEL